MTEGLHRFYGNRYQLHFITCSCFHRQPFLTTPERRDFFLEELERLRISESFRVEGYVVMPTHIHILISEPEKGNPSTVMQLLKQRTGLKFNREMKRPVGSQFWQKRFHDFNVYTHEKRVEKIHYMHDNPRRKGLVEDPWDWKWSSCRYYRTGEPGMVTVDFRE